MDIFELAEYTNRSIFLTGKAGTGKTTFLNDFVRRTAKKHIVLAPTGIAAINAGGVTIHSMFGLPLRNFIPTLDRTDENRAMNIPDLVSHFRYRKDKLKLLREVEIIIIDEVSMLRADVLDMVDFSLRHIRRNAQKFGGVQMLFIGDLYQLPPVVKDEEFMMQFYSSPFFFDSFALKELPLITVELTKVYRQKDEQFLKILNAIRSGNCDEIDFEKLNSRYIPNFEPGDEAFVHLTSHNFMADGINRKKLGELHGQSYFYPAEIEGDFNENQFPNDAELELRVGAQVMFIRNDASSERRYFNGKLAEVVALSEDEISVIIDGENEPYKLKREIWLQKKYSLAADKSIQEEVLGSFQQFPIRLAWAVTIHKSQGLTFDRVIIDAGKSFASGQVYVALSRCRTLEGIVLKSKITREVIFSDHRVENFQSETSANDRISEILSAEKFDFAIAKVLRFTDLQWIKQAVSGWYDSAKTSRFLDKEKAADIHFLLEKDVDNLAEIYAKFAKILTQKSRRNDVEDNWAEVEAKAKGAVNFFYQNVNEKVYIPLKEFYAETKGMKGLKEYNEVTRTLLTDLEDYLEDLKRVKLIDYQLFNKAENSEINKAVAKKPSPSITFEMFQNGKSIPEICKARGLMKSTIYGHLAEFASKGLLEIERIVPKERLEIFGKAFAKDKMDWNLTQWRNFLPSEFEFQELGLLVNHFTFLAKNDEEF